MARNLVLNLLFSCLGAAVLFTACDEQRVFEQNIDLPENRWHKDSALVFTVAISDAQPAYNILYNIRNDRAYGAQNLYLQIEVADSTGRTLAQDLNNIELFDAKTGEPYGKGIDVLDHQIMVFPDFRFPAAGQYTVRVQHQMREQAGGVPIAENGILKDIVAVGVRVERTAPPATN